jgi:hypothetical protein
MTQRDETQLVLTLGGFRWQAELLVEPPRVGAGEQIRKFDVPPLGGSGAPLQRISTSVRYTRAVNRNATGWQQWHVKVYRCATQDEAEALRLYLRQQAVDIQRANAQLDGPSRGPVEPPWAVVPVQIVTGDGRGDDGSDHTELAAPAERLDAQVRGALPAWLVDEPPTPELYLLAVSPLVDQVRWRGFRPHPAVEHLADFKGMATGLDTLHHLGMVHADIKPENVCRYRAGRSTGFVLIDIDAATRFVPPPVTLRSTRAFQYRGIKLAVERGAGRLEAHVLRAHDRFGFALVVLAALAGREWVEGTLLSGTHEGHSRRPVDDQERVAELLSTHWRDSADRWWAPLIDVVVEPFGTTDIEDDDWSARQWLERLLVAEKRCVVPRQPPDRTLPQAPPELFTEEIARIRAEANQLPAPRTQRVEYAYDAIQRHAQAVALRSGLRVALAWAVAAGCVVFVFMICLLGVGQ